jgi:hypothetical protein
MSYSLINLTSDISLSWAYPFTGGVVVSDINDVVASGNDFTLTLPNAKFAPLGTTILFNNVGSHEFTLLDYSHEPLTYFTIDPGEIQQIYLTNSDTEGGIWRIIPYGGGVGAINRIDFKSPTNTVLISPASVVSPAGNLTFDVSKSLQNLDNLTNNAAAGFPVITANNPLEWKTVVLVGGTNVNIDNRDGVFDAPIINLNSAISGLTALNVGSFALSGTTLTTSETDGSLALSSNGKGHLGLNGVNIDTLSNITNVNNLTVSGSITSPAVASAQCFFFDNNNVTNNITLQSNYNIASVTGGNGAYVVTFTIPFPDGNYTVLLSLCRGTETIAPFTAFFRSRSAESMIIYTVDTLGNLVTAADGVSVVIFGN